MLKLVGALLVIGGTTCLGFSWKQDLYYKLYHTKCLRSIIELLESEIRYSKSSLPEACRMVSQRIEAPYSAGLFNVWEIMCANKGLTFAMVWKQEMGKCLHQIPVGKKEKDIFIRFVENSGFAENRMQLRTLEQCREVLGQSIQKQEENMENKTKVVMSMGLIGGLFLTIVLL